ncbi:MAG: tRNA (adenosine(37)-N6)-threonylcarbamoyltransferase complex dimerization subunit type 1 TsaB [Bacteroidales bacterium]|nr:tRNA (adenosine(37)-N6)-threonylcarbamoyltransferase complex dimerization subunit type 1 TsaB [Bacteroidales bacterium]
MAKIILIETTAADCTVALGVDGVAVAFAKADEPRSHASMTAPLVAQVLAEAGLKASDCDAVCLSKGPGSYTGLRVGSSTAKGLCFGTSLPLIALDTSTLIATQALTRLLADHAPFNRIITMIDARRMEVYASTFEVLASPSVTPDEAPPVISSEAPPVISSEVEESKISPRATLGRNDSSHPLLRQLTPVAPVVVGEGTFGELAGEGPVLFAGDGALKCREILSAALPDATFAEVLPHAEAMAPLAEAAFAASRFEDIAYFEPFYLKQFVATTPRNKIF